MSKGKKIEKVVPLTPSEIELLQEHELVISQGEKAFVAVGVALLAIRDGKLYRENYTTFEAYCQERWDFGARRGRQFINAAILAQEMGTDCSPLELENESQARALAMVPPHLRKDVLAQLHAQDEKPTEQTVTKAVNRVLEQKRAEAKEREQAGVVKDDENENEDGSELADSPSTATTKQSAASAAETVSDRTIKRVAARCEKERLYLSRGLEHLRLAVKDLGKVRATDLKTTEAQQAAREGLDAADAVFSDVRGWLV